MVFKVFCFSLLLLLFSCIDEITYEPEKMNDAIYVDAEIALEDTIHQIKIVTSQEVSSQITTGLSGAKVSLINETGGRFDFLEIQDDGMYIYKGKLDVEVKYGLEIIINNSIITGDKQGFPNPFDIDSISFNVEKEEIQNPNGTINTRDVVNYFANFTKEKIDHEFFLRLGIDETVFVVTEIQCSPVIVPKTCYVYNNDSNLPITLFSLSPSNLKTTIKQKFFTKLHTHEFGAAYSVVLDVISYNKEQFEYWEKLKSLYEQTGAIQDKIPSRLSTSLTSSSNNVFGHFAMVRKSKAIHKITRGQTNIPIEPFCGTPGFYIPYPWPDQCCDCFLFKNSTKQKPYYW